MLNVRPAGAGSFSTPGADGPAGSAEGAEGVAEGTAGVGGSSVAALDFAGVDATTGGGGRYSFCHASHSISAEAEKTTNRMRRWVSMTAWVTARGGQRRGR